jgi:hypothetical protein
MKKHKFSHTIVEHHGDGSATVHHIHESSGHTSNVPVGADDVRGAVADHDSLMDHMMDHTSMPNQGEDQDENEEAMEEKLHPGIHDKIEQIKKGK